MGDPCPYGFNHTGCLHTKGLRKGQRVQTRALIHIDIVKPAGFMSNANLPIAGLSGWHVHNLQLIGTPKFFDHNGLIHHTLPI
jgi:hypothetical protein